LIARWLERIFIKHEVRTSSEFVEFHLTVL
jgi:hypothetical protein